MKHITDAKDVQELKNAKMLNEFKLAKALSDFFYQDPLLNQQTQRVASLALSLLNDLNHIIFSNQPDVQNSQLKQACLNTYEQEHPLAIWENKGEPFSKNDLEHIVKRRIFELWEFSKTPLSSDYGLTVQDCGEVIRLFAAICEAVYKNPEDPSTDLAKTLELKITDALPDKPLALVRESDLQKQVKPEQAEHAIDFGADFCGLRPAYRTTAWGEIAFHKDNHKRQKRHSVDLKHYFNDDTIQHLKQEVLGLHKEMKTGISTWELQAGSIVRGIDRMFGLPEGADISGTMSDAIWATEALSYLNQTTKPNTTSSSVGEYSGDDLNDNTTVDNDADPNILLLPIASIVAGHHHTILECALSLNINGYGQYSPGFFTTLQTEEMKDTKVGQSISTLLEEYEQSHENPFLFIYSDTSGEQAFQATDQIEISLFKNFTQLSPSKYKQWKGYIDASSQIAQKLSQARVDLLKQHLNESGMMKADTYTDDNNLFSPEEYLDDYHDDDVGDDYYDNNGWGDYDDKDVSNTSIQSTTSNTHGDWDDGDEDNGDWTHGETADTTIKNDKDDDIGDDYYDNNGWGDYDDKDVSNTSIQSATSNTHGDWDDEDEDDGDWTHGETADATAKNDKWDDIGNDELEDWDEGDDWETDVTTSMNDSLNHDKSNAQSASEQEATHHDLFNTQPANTTEGLKQQAA